MELDKVKVTAQIATGWERAKRMALATEGKKMVTMPDEEWKRKMLACEHSPIRMVEYDITIENIPQWVSVHLVRHHIGCEKFVATQRTDRNANIKCNRDDLPQGELNTMTFVANAQALINISRVRLCGKASPETRVVWQLVKDAIKDIDPIMASFMQPNCIYRGRCPEIKCCGYNKSYAYKDGMLKYDKLFSNNACK